MISWIFLILMSSKASASTAMSCHSLFTTSHWQKTVYKIEQLNLSDSLHDVILVQESPMLEVIRSHLMEDLIFIVNERIRLQKPLVFYDEINLAVALGYNDIAMYLTNVSDFPYAITPMREDFLTTALYFDNQEMLSFFTDTKKFYFARGAR